MHNGHGTASSGGRSYRELAQFWARSFDTRRIFEGTNLLLKRGRPSDVVCSCFLGGVFIVVLMIQQRKVGDRLIHLIPSQLTFCVFRRGQFTREDCTPRSSSSVPAPEFRLARSRLLAHIISPFLFFPIRVGRSRRSTSLPRIYAQLCDRSRDAPFHMEQQLRTCASLPCWRCWVRPAELGLLWVRADL